ncbi:MAG: YihY/virulence factor BrkB family protein [Casimicrobiaceae bacterium]
MRLITETFERLLLGAGAFALRVVRGFRANQGFLLASAVAFNTLLSILPLSIVILIVLARFVDESALLSTLARYIEIIVPGESTAIMRELSLFLQHREGIGWVLAVTLLFFSSLAFSVLENAMSVIFYHRVAVRKRRLVVSILIPIGYLLFLAVGLLVVTGVTGALLAMGQESFAFLGRDHSLDRLSAFLLYLVGVAGEILMLTSLYMVMPVGRPVLSHALIGGTTAAILWEITRHLLAWYFSTFSQVGLVYGSLATAIVVLLSLEIAALVLLLGAQVIAEYERFRDEPDAARPESLHTD